MTLVLDLPGRAPRRDAEAPPADGPVVQVPEPPAAERFPVFGRMAGALWFGLLALIQVKAALGPLSALVSGAGGYPAAMAVASRVCVGLFYGLTCWLLMARPPPVARQNRTASVFTAFVGTYLVWLLPLIPDAPAWPPLQAAADTICLIGDALVVYTLCKLGRSFSITPQARKLVTDGPYRLIRHPLYAAEAVALLGVLLQHVWWGALAFLAVHFTFQLRRMRYEESLLRAVFPEYDAYARRTARLVPGVW